MATIYSNRVAGKLQKTPPVQPEPSHYKGEIKQLIDYVDVPANAPDGQVFEFGNIPAEAVINTALSKIVWDGVHGSARKFQVGTEKDSDCIGANIDASAASGVAGVPLFTGTIDQRTQTLKELSAATSDAQQKLQVKLTGGTGSATASKIAIELYYT